MACLEILGVFFIFVKIDIFYLPGLCFGYPCAILLRFHSRLVGQCKVIISIFYIYFSKQSKYFSLSAVYDMFGCAFIIYYLMSSGAGSGLLKAWNLPRCVVGKEAIHILLTHLH